MKVIAKKAFVQGLLAGTTIEEPINFRGWNWDKCCEWAGKVTMNVSCNYVVLELTNTETGEKEHF